LFCFGALAFLAFTLKNDRILKFIMSHKLLEQSISGLTVSRALDFKHKLDFVLGLEWGDEGKGKVLHSLLNTAYTTDQCYDWCVRVGGGNNAGHTIYIQVDGFKIKIDTHIVPSGIVIPDLKCLIGTGCVVDEDILESELTRLEKYIPDARSRLYVSRKAHIITKENIAYDKEHNAVGSTCCGIGPTYAGKAYRTNPRVEDRNGKHHVWETVKVVDPKDIFMGSKEPLKIMVEGAQGYWLDIDRGDYPYVTSSDTTINCCASSMLRTCDLNMSVGVIKAYTTYVGSKTMQEQDHVFQAIASLGHEYGVTTGRLRQVLFLNLARLLEPIFVNRVNALVINKSDILDLVQKYIDAGVVQSNGDIEFECPIYNKDLKTSVPTKLLTKYKTVYNVYGLDGNLRNFQTNNDMREYVNDVIHKHYPDITIVWSTTPYDI